MHRKPRDYYFPIGGDRVLSISSPFTGERPFADRFARMASQLVDLVNMAQFGATSVSTGGIRHRSVKTTSSTPYAASICSETIAFPYTEEMLACGPAKFRGLFPILCWGISLNVPNVLTNFSLDGSRVYTTPTVLALTSLSTRANRSVAVYGAHPNWVPWQEFEFFVDVLLSNSARIAKWDEGYRFNGQQETTTCHYYALRINCNRDQEAILPKGLAAVVHSIRVDQHQVIRL